MQRLVTRACLFEMLCLAGAAVFMVASASAEDRAPRLELGRVMPRLSGEFLTGGEAILPDAARGKVALVALGFSYESRGPVEAWIKRFRELYPPGDHVTFFEVPMLGRGARLGRWFIDRGMRRGTPRNLHEHVVTVYGDVGAWKQRLQVTDDRLAYLVLVDSAGRVRWLHAGRFDETGLTELRSAVDRLLSSGGH